MDKKEVYNCLRQFLENLKKENIDCLNLDINKIVNMYKLYSKNK